MTEDLELILMVPVFEESKHILPFLREGANKIEITYGS